MAITTFTWVGGADIDGPNNWMTPANWVVAGVPSLTVPNDGTVSVTVNTDDGTKDAIISAGQTITIGDLSIGGVTVGAVQGGHVVVGGSTAIGGGGGGTLNVVNGITVTSTNPGGALVGGNNGVITAPTMTITGGPDVLIGGGGTFDIPTIINNGGILGDGGRFDLGPLVINATTISGTGFIEVGGSSTVEINAATAQEVRVDVAANETATLIFDKPTLFTGSINLLNPNSQVNLFFAGETPTGVTYDPDTHALVITGAGGAVLNTIPFTSNGVVPIGVITSTMPGFGEVVLGAPQNTIVPGIPAPVDGVSTTTMSSADLSALLQGDQSAMRFVAGTESIILVDGRLSVGADTNEAYLTRLYEGMLGRAPDTTGLSGWDATLAGSTKADIAQVFLNSTEFQTAHPGQDDTSFVTSLYQGMLGRAPDADGLNAWTQLLGGGMARADAVVAFADSPEAKTHWATVTSSGVFSFDQNSAIVREDYLTGLGRDAETSGLAYWTNFLKNGGSAQQLAEVMTNAPEFQALHGQQSDADYVASLYQGALGRPADQGGEAFWTNALQTGTSRAAVLSAFAQSTEGQQHLHWALTT